MQVKAQMAQDKRVEMWALNVERYESTEDEQRLSV